MINPRSTLTAVAAAALLAGCSFIPAYERPAAPIPSAYATAPADTAGTPGAASVARAACAKDSACR